MTARPDFVPDDFELQPRECPVPGYDIAIGDDVWWKGRESEGLFYVGCMARYTADMKPAASVWNKGVNYTAPLEELICIVDAEWWGLPRENAKSDGTAGDGTKDHG